VPRTIGKLAASTAPAGATHRDDERALVTGTPGAVLGAERDQMVGIIDDPVTGGPR
jgi:hypothetical protein